MPEAVRGRETTNIMSDCEKIYCCDRDNNDALYALMANQRGGDAMNGQWNNPFVYLVWMMFAQRMWGNGYGGDGAGNPQVAQLQNQMQDNQNANMIIDAIKGNGAQIGQLASNLNCDFNTLNASICDVRNGINKLSGEVGFSAERVINAVNMGDCHVIEALNACCCNTQKELIRMQGDLNLGMCQQTNTLQNGQSELRVALDKGLATSAFETQRQTCDLINNQNANTQRIIDTLNGHWRSELENKLQEEKFEKSQLKQNIYLAGLIKGENCGCGCNGQ